MLSISDWISFLTSEKNSNRGNIFSLTAVIIAAVVLLLSVTNSNWGSAVGAAVICASLLLVYYKTTNQYEQHAKEAGKLLKDIMSGEERDPLKIEERWKRETSSGRGKTEE
jgi:Ca2+/Na+ antiporter